MGKFAEKQLHKRKANELGSYYQRAGAYHIQYAEHLYKFVSEDSATRSARAASRFNQQQANFFKSIDYLHVADVSTEKLLRYLDNLCMLAITTTLSKNFSEILIKASSINSYLKDEKEKLCFELLILKSKYYAGDFENSFYALQKKVPLNILTQFEYTLPIDKIICRIGFDIYAMEGEVLSELKYDMKSMVSYRGYPITLFQIGEINRTLAMSYKSGFYNLDARYALGMLNSIDVDECIANTYEKDHLNLMELHYLKAKLSLRDKATIDSHQIQNLVIVNPYTLGLQQLMLAFSSDTDAETILLYEQALNNLFHIKYYYVEALLYFSSYLKNNQRPEFIEIYQRGYELTCQHHYRWLRYQFEDLIEKKTTAYNSENYPLPEELDIEGYIQWSIKQNNAA